MKIEAGCKAVIVNSAAGNNGIIVNVLELAGPAGLYGFATEDGARWEIDQTIISKHGTIVNHVGENQLKRIDDDSRQVVSWDELADIWVPDRKEVEA